MTLEEFMTDLKSTVQKAIDSLPVGKAKPENITQEEWDKLSPEEQAKLGKVKKPEEYLKPGEKAKKKPGEAGYEEENAKKPEDFGYGAETKKALEALLKAIDLTVETSPLAKAFSDIRKEQATVLEALGKMLERVENIEKGTAVKKSIDGDDAADKTKIKKAAGAGFDGVVKTLLVRKEVRLN